MSVANIVEKKFIENFFSSDLKSSDPEIFNSIQKEFVRKQNQIELN